MNAHSATEILVLHRILALTRNATYRIDFALRDQPTAPRTRLMHEKPSLTQTELSDALKRYADLTIECWGNVQPGQSVLIIADRTQHLLAEMIATAAETKRRAGTVRIYWKDAARDLERLRIDLLEDLKRPDPLLIQYSDELVDTHGCLISIAEGSDSSVYTQFEPERLHALESAKDEARATLLRRGLGENRITRCLLAAANATWADTVFPEIAPERRLLTLWQAILDSCCVREQEPEVAFRAIESSLALARDKLQSLQLESLHFSGPGTDLTVPLSTEAIWLAGEKKNRDGIPYFANVPIGEIFTTPDHRGVTGKARITMPSIISEALVDGITLEFRDGEVVHAAATQGDRQLQLLLETDGGSKRLGEVALVGNDAPLFHSRILFRETLLDEKGKSHIALGYAYKNCIKNGAELTPEDMFVLGINDSTVHHDLMIGDEDTVITGRNRSGSWAIMDKGAWRFERL